MWTFCSDFLFFSFYEVAHKIYGIPQTINTANYVYFLAYQELFALRSADSTTSNSTSSSSSPRRPLDALVTGEPTIVDYFILTTNAASSIPLPVFLPSIMSRLDCLIQFDHVAFFVFFI